jgi:hypothetical protein
LAGAGHLGISSAGEGPSVKGGGAEVKLVDVLV